MDARVNAFLSEINEIAPLNDKNDCAWEKCYDDDSGYYYYWNTKTNEVTWDMPVEYKSKQPQQQQQKKKPVSLYMPPRTAPLFPSTSGLIPPVGDAIKIYKIGQSTDTAVKNVSTNNTATTLPKVQTVEKTAIVKHKEEDTVEINTKLLKEPKVALISSYGDDSDSENEDTTNKNDKLTNDLPTTTIKTEGEIAIKAQEKSAPKETSKNNEISGFSLVAGYGSDDDDGDNNDDDKKPQSSDSDKVAHSTLFPITKPINIKDFEESDKIQNNDDDFVDTKAFQRKRRIGVAVLNTTKKPKINETDEILQRRRGLGFSNDTTTTPSSSSSTTNHRYPGFTKGGVLFGKSASDISTTNPNKDDREDLNDTKDIVDSYSTLKEKLSFLSEGREDVSPVQLMLIQLETLYTALKAGDLKQNYLQKWLDDTCGDLIKLEKETTPEGWLLQWDRSHKRYYYQNETTGDSQWEYPQTDVTRCDEAMDISTTPPPPPSSSSSNHEQNIQQTSPPLPPKISSPTPSPAPVISDKKNTKIDIGDSSEGNSRDSTDVDAATQKSKETGDNLSEALNSFYSDIAAIDTSNSPPAPAAAAAVSEDIKIEPNDNLSDVSKKKKKTKVKLVQGIAMKKKGVSKLVEKWKNVQLSYSD